MQRSGMHGECAAIPRDLTAHFDGAVMKGNLRIDGSGVAYQVEFVRN